MRILFALGHPAHFHLFKNAISSLENDGSDIEVVIKSKDVLEDLLVKSNIAYTNLLPEGRRRSFSGALFSMAKSGYRLYKTCRINRPALMVGTSTEIALVGALLKIPSLVFVEDDAKVVPLFCAATYPFASHIISPEPCDNGRWNNKTIKYKGFQKLAYLHPTYFTPDKQVLKKYACFERTYFLIRVVQLSAHHDRGIRGLSDELLGKLVSKLKPYGNVFISSERPLPSFFDEYQLKVEPLDIHHVLAFAKLLIGDSQSMTIEAALLGTPSIRYSDFSGRISVLEVLEKKYNLTCGIKPDDQDKLFRVIDDMLNSSSSEFFNKVKFKEMISEHVDVTAFIVWLIKNYPESILVMKSNPATT